MSQRLNSLLLHNSKSLNLSPNPSHRLIQSRKSPQLRSSWKSLSLSQSLRWNQNPRHSLSQSLSPSRNLCHKLSHSHSLSQHRSQNPSVRLLLKSLLLRNSRSPNLRLSQRLRPSHRLIQSLLLPHSLKSPRLRSS